MERFSLTVGGIDRREYYQACHESARRFYLLLAVSMFFFCGLIILLTGNASAAAFLGPAAIYAAIVVLYEIVIRVSYKDQLAVIDPPVEYEFTGDGWHVRKGDVTAELSWDRTPALRRTKVCLFLYNDETTSNLLPRRLMTDGQTEAVETWFRDSRAAYREYRKNEDRMASRRFRERNPDLRLGRTGPAWGPWKRR